MKLNKLILLNLILFSFHAFAYPEFIGFGYTACMTCHYNGNGGGALNDYGRALWSAEIASRAFYPSTMTDEDIANQSGFFGSLKPLKWLNPQINYRGLFLDVNPGSSGGEFKKFFNMQTDVGATVLFDENERWIASFTFGHIVRPEDYSQGKEAAFDRMLGREYYLRTEILKSTWLYVGLLEKVFGIRNIDHTSYQRSHQGFNESLNTKDGGNMSQGIILQKATDSWEVSGNYFIGNPYDDESYKQKGFSMMGEYEPGEKKRIGASLMTAKNNFLKKDMFEIHYRQGLSKGSAIMLEYGLIQDEASTGIKNVGSYNLIQSLIEIARGYNLKATAERYNKAFKASEPDNWKMSFGFLMFPLPRLEIRTELVNENQISSGSSNPDTWEIQGQIHATL